MNYATIATALTLLTSCNPSYYKAVVIGVDKFSLRVDSQVSKTYIITAVITPEQIDTIKKGDLIYIDKKTLKVITK